MTASDHRALTDGQRHTLNEVANVLTPGGRGFPSPTEADPDGAVLDLALHHLRHVLPELIAMLDLAADRDPAGFLDELEQRDPDGLALIRTLVVARYLSCRPVWDALGYTGHVPSPVAAGEAADYLRDEILEPVIGRGSVYLPTPGLGLTP